jgi:hypothetical protein
MPNIDFDQKPRGAADCGEHSEVAGISESLIGGTPVTVANFFSP